MQLVLMSRDIVVLPRLEVQLEILPFEIVHTELHDRIEILPVGNLTAEPKCIDDRALLGAVVDGLDLFVADREG